MTGTSYQMLDVLAFCNRERAQSTSFNNDNSANVSGEKKCNKDLRGVYFLTIGEKTLNQISNSKSFSSSNLKVSNRRTERETPSPALGICELYQSYF